MSSFNEKKYTAWLKKHGKRRSADTVIEYILEGAVDGVNLGDLKGRIHEKPNDWLCAIGINYNQNGSQDIEISVGGKLTNLATYAAISAMINGLVLERTGVRPLPLMYSDEQGLAFHALLLTLGEAMEMFDGLSVESDEVDRAQVDNSGGFPA